MTVESKTSKPPAASAPNASARRFLAQLMEYCFREGWRTPDDFVKHFPADTMMKALEKAPDLRVAILAAATGIYEDILRRKSPALAAEDLSLALDEGTTSSLQLLSVFTPEDRVRFLDARRIWDFLAEDQFWRFDVEATEEQRHGAAERMSFTLTQAVQERLLTLRDILEGLTYDAVADSLSPHELRTVVRHALVKGRDGIGLNEKVLLEVLPLDKLVRSMPLEHIWNEVVLRRLAVPMGLAEPPRDERREERRSSASERPASERWSSRASVLPPPLPPELARPAAPESRPLPPPAPLPASPNQAYFHGEMPGSRPPSFEPNGYPLNVAGTNDYVEEDDELTTAAPPVVSVRDNSLLPPPLPSAPSSARPAPDEYATLAMPAASVPPPPPSSRKSSPQQFDTQDADVERQRQRVTEHLRAIGRLPPRHASMPAAVLRSIDAMYAILPSATDDIQRKSVIRQAFGNDHHLRVALLGLIELMDSSVDTSDPVIQEAKIDALIKILLFEEQRRKENGRYPSGFGGQRMPSSGAEGQGFYFPQSMASQPVYGGSHVPTQRPPPPVLGAVGPGAAGQGGGAPGSMLPGSMLPGGVLPAYAGSQPPLPNLPADPPSGRRRTMPPPLPPSYSRG